MSFILSSGIFSGILSLFIMSPDVLAGIWPFLVFWPSDILSWAILSWDILSSFILSWAIAAVARPNTIISVVSCFFIVVLLVFDTELLRAVAPDPAQRARRPGIRFEPYDGGYWQFETGGAAA